MSALAASLAERFRPMVRADLGTVARIERRSYGYPWSRGVFRDCLNAGYCCQVQERQGLVVGYGILSVVLDEAHVLNLCIDPDWRNRGLARQLLDHLCELARVYGGRSLFLEVRPSNAPAVHLYRSSGFCEVGTRWGYYPGPQGREDALIMARTLVAAE